MKLVLRLYLLPILTQEVNRLKHTTVRPLKVIELTQEPYNFKVRRIYLGNPKESELWVKCASILFNCDPDELRKNITAQ